MPESLRKYRPAALPRPDAGLVVLGVTNVVALDETPTLPFESVRVSAAGKWTRDVHIPVGTAARVAQLAANANVVWASEWGPNAHVALRGALRLPADPWPYLPVQFDKGEAIERLAVDRSWVWVDDPLVDLATDRRSDGNSIRVDPRQGLMGIARTQFDEILAKLRMSNA